MPDEELKIRETILLAGEHLVSHGRPGRWEVFDAEVFLEQIAFLPESDRMGRALILVGLFGWLAIVGGVQRGVAVDVVCALEKHAPDSPILSERDAAS